MVDRSSFARPTNLADVSSVAGLRIPLTPTTQQLYILHVQATGRLRKNALYFKVNYLVVIVTITAVTMALYPTSLIVLGCLALAWLYLFVVKQSPLVIGGRTFK